jgi:hypothetical protein
MKPVKPSKSKSSKPSKPKTPNLKHQCDWRVAAIKLAGCVAATLKTGGKIGMGSGMVMKVVDGKKIIERWDKDFIEALAFIGIEVVDKPQLKAAKRTQLTARPAHA